MTNTSAKTVIFSAPQAWGKTRNAQALMQEFGCTSVVDDWEPTFARPITPGALHLTNATHSQLQGAVPASCKVVFRGWP